MAGRWQSTTKTSGRGRPQEGWPLSLTSQPLVHVLSATIDHVIALLASRPVAKGIIYRASERKPPAIKVPSLVAMSMTLRIPSFRLDRTNVFGVHLSPAVQR